MPTSLSTCTSIPWTPAEPDPFDPNTWEEPAPCRLPLTDRDDGPYALLDPEDYA